MKTFRNITRFIVITITFGISVFFLFLVFTTNLVRDLLNSNPSVLLALGITIGIIVGLLVGFIATYLRFANSLEKKDLKITNLEEDLSNANDTITQLRNEQSAQKRSNSTKDLFRQTSQNN